MLGKLRLQAREPLRVGCGKVGKQFAPCAHRGFITIAMLGMARVEGEDKAVEEAPPIARRFDEQAIHRRGEPEDGKPVAKRGRGGGAAVDPDDPAPRGRGFDAGTERHRRERRIALHLAEHGKATGRTVAHHIGQRRAPQPAPRCKQRYRFQYIRLARAIVAVKRHKAWPSRQIGPRVIAEIGQRKADQRHLHCAYPSPERDASPAHHCCPAKVKRKKFRFEAIFTTSLIFSRCNIVSMSKKRRLTANE